LGVASLLVAVVALLAVTAAAPARDRCCNEESVEIQAAGYTIPGTLTTPRGKERGGHPAVLLLHGTASDKDEVGEMYARLAQKLGRLGYASLRIDFAGSGDSKLPQTAFTYTEEVADTKTALGWLARHPRIDRNALGLVGFSQGGRVAATVAGTDDRVKAVTTWSTWVEDGSTAYLAFGPAAYEEAKRNGSVVVDLGFRTWEFSLAFFESIKASHPLEDIEAYRGPLLGIEGTADFLWPQTKQELFAAGSYDSALHVVPGGDHIFHVLEPDQTQAEDVMDTTVEWFADNLGPRKRKD
jgi:dienelactone hydrolase